MSEFNFLSDRIYMARHSKRYSMRDLAEKLEVSANAIKKWENGESCPDSSHLIALSKTLGVSVNWLMTEDRVILEKCGVTLPKLFNILPEEWQKSILEDKIE